MGWSLRGCEQMAKLRAFKNNGGKVIDLLEYQEKQKRRKERKEHEKLLKELRSKHTEAAYEERIRCSIPGLDNHSMEWLRNIINGVLTA